MVKYALPGRSILGVDDHSQWLAGGQLRAYDINGVVWVDLIVVCWIRKGQGKHTLLLQVGFVLSTELVQIRIENAITLTMRAKLRVMIARPPKCLGSSAACSRDEPSP